MKLRLAAAALALLLAASHAATAKRKTTSSGSTGDDEKTEERAATTAVAEKPADSGAPATSERKSKSAAKPGASSSAAKESDESAASKPRNNPGDPQPQTPAKTSSKGKTSSKTGGTKTQHGAGDASKSNENAAHDSGSSGSDTGAKSKSSANKEAGTAPVTSEVKALSENPKVSGKKLEQKAVNAATKTSKPPQDNAGDEPRRGASRYGPNITLNRSDLAGFDQQPPRVQQLIRTALELTHRNLTYRYGSSDPSTGGMDCSGTIYYLLKAIGIPEPPRDSSGLYLWTQKEGTLHVVSPASLDDPALALMRPGDLMFWEGTYEVQRDPPISHTMIYLGREKVTGLPVMIGSSDGRTYDNIRRNGVSVFDFNLPRSGSSARFVGYARIPGL